MNIDKLIKEAMLEKNSAKKEAYRAIKAEILLQQTAKNAKEINEISIIIKYLKELLPPEISRDKIQEAVIIAYPNGYSQKEMGKVIKEIKNIYPTANGKLISEIVKEHIV